MNDQVTIVCSESDLTAKMMAILDAVEDGVRRNDPLALTKVSGAVGELSTFIEANKKEQTA